MRQVGRAAVPEQESAVQLRPALGDRSPTSRWLSSTCWPTRCSPRTSTRAASSRISTSSPGRRCSAVNFPNGAWGCDGGSGDVDFGSHAAAPDQRLRSHRASTTTTLGDELDNGRLPWAFYTASLDGDGNIWSAYQANQNVYYGPTGAKTSSRRRPTSSTTFRSGKLRAVSWVTPTCENSDHAGCGSNTGPAWVTSLVNAVGESKYWDSTAIFIFWDDYGGWFDPVAAGVGGLRRAGHAHPDGHHFAVREEGLRLGDALRARQHPEVRRGSVRPAQALRQRLAVRTRSRRMLRLLAVPRKFQKIKAPLDENYFMHQPLDRRPPDNS